MTKTFTIGVLLFAACVFVAKAEPRDYRPNQGPGQDGPGAADGPGRADNPPSSGPPGQSPGNKRHLLTATGNPGTSNSASNGNGGNGNPGDNNQNQPGFQGRRMLGSAGPGRWNGPATNDGPARFDGPAKFDGPSPNDGNSPKDGPGNNP